MEKKTNKTTTTPSAVRRFRLFGIVAAITIAAIGIVAAVSAQIGIVNPVPNGKKGVTAVSKSAKNSKSIAGQAAQTDQNGQIRPLTAQEAQKLADGIKGLVNQSDEGLEQVYHSDGSVSVDLQGRFQNVAVAKKKSDGTIDQSCLDNTQSAAEFFNIDPQRFGDDPSKAGLVINKTEKDANGGEIK